ncbi:MAG TPA: MFS transporter [Stellaceae bacterium]|nr:MFS transporter [Stellaceae bacterium]
MSARARLATGWLTLFVIGTDLFVVSPLLPLIAGEFHLSAAAAGSCATVFSATYMLSAPVFGALADRFGRRPILTAALAAFALSNLLTASAGGFFWLILWRGAAGVAAAGVTPLVYAAVSEAAPPARRATWMACAVSGLLSALSMGAPLGALLGAAWGWRAPFLVLAGLSLALALAGRRVWPQRAPPAAAGAPPAAALGTGFALRLAPTVLWATALYGMYTYLGLGLVGAGFSPTQVARTISLYGFAALVGTLLGGRAADRIGVRKTILASLAGLALCLAALGTALRAEWSLDLAVVLLSVVAQLFFPAQQAALARDFPERRASALAWNNSALFLGITLGALVGGQAMTRAGFLATTALVAQIACAALLVVVFTREASTTAKTPGDRICTKG